jgi:hypothetical protein
MTALSAALRKTNMTTFTIDTDNNITAHGTPEEAAATTATPFDTFASQKELTELAVSWPAERLVAIWNSLPGVTPAKKFKDRTTAATRIWKNIQGLGESVKPNPAQPVQLKAARKALSRNNYRFMFVMPLQRERHLYSPAVVRGEKIGADKEQNDLC